MNWRILLGIVFFVLLIGSAQAALVYSLCNNVQHPTPTQVDCYISANRMNNTMGLDDSKLSQAQITSFWNAIAANEPNATKVKWIIQNAQVYTKIGEDLYLRKNTGQTGIEWDIDITRTAGTASLRNRESEKGLFFTTDVDDVTIEGNLTQEAYIYGYETNNRDVEFNISGDLSIKNGGRVLWTGNVIVAGNLIIDAPRVAGQTWTQLLFVSGQNHNLQVAGNISMNGYAQIYYLQGNVNVTGDITLRDCARVNLTGGADASYEATLAVNAKKLDIQDPNNNCWTSFRKGAGNVTLNKFYMKGAYAQFMTSSRDWDLTVQAGNGYDGGIYYEGLGSWAYGADYRFYNLGNVTAESLTLIHAQMIYIKRNITISGAVNLTNSDIVYVNYDNAGSTVHVTGDISTVNSRIYCYYECNIDIDGDLTINGRGPGDQSIHNPNRMDIGGDMKMTNGYILHVGKFAGHVVTGEPGIFVTGTAGINSFETTNSQIHFTDGLHAPIVVSNGNMVVTGRYGSEAIHWPRQIRVENGNLTVTTTEAGRPPSIWGQRYGEIYASGNITFENVAVDGWNSGSSGEGITAIESALGNITVNNAFLYTVKGPIKALDGRVSFTGTAPSDILLKDASVVGIYAKEFFVKNAGLYDITYNCDGGRTDPAKYGAIEVSGLMKLENVAIPATDSWGDDVRWVHAGALEMTGSLLDKVRGDIILQDYGKLVNSAIVMDDTETIDDPADSLKKIEITLPSSQSFGFYMEGTAFVGHTGRNEGIAAKWATPITISNKGDAAHGMTFKNTMIDNTGEALTIESCILDVSPSGSLQTFSNGGNLITGNSSDLGKINMTTALMWAQHACAKSGPNGVTCSIAANPASKSGTGDFNSNITVTFSASMIGQVNVNCGNGTSWNAPIVGTTALGICRYAALPPEGSRTYTVIASSGNVQCDRDITHNVFGGPGADTPVPTVLAVGAFILDSSRNPVTGRLKVLVDVSPGGSCPANPFELNIQNGIVDTTYDDCELIPGQQYTTNVSVVIGTTETPLTTVSFYA